MKIKDVNIGQFVVAKGGWEYDKQCYFTAKYKSKYIDRYFMVTSIDHGDNTVWLDGAGWWPIEFIELSTTLKVWDKIRELEGELSRLKYAINNPVIHDVFREKP